MVYENFNAARWKSTYRVTAHRCAKACWLIRADGTGFISHFDRAETPENTEGREGYVWFNGMSATQQGAQLKASIRDFDSASFAARKQKIQDVAKIIAAQYPTAKVSVDISDTYSNISSAIGEDRRAIDLIFAGLKEIGVERK